ncbi:MAG: pyruvate, phosphate dikinase [Candidatus Aminicenantes bacterium]
MVNKYVYFFSKDFTEGKKELKELLGGKGANLAEMCNLKLPIPPGFTITTQVCEFYYKNNKCYPEGLEVEVEANLQKLEALTGKKFGDSSNPLLVSIRSGAATPIPGMMNTILNLGLNDNSVKGLAKLAYNERFAYDSYCRFIQMFGYEILGVEHGKFEEILYNVQMNKGVHHDLDLDVDDLRKVVAQFKALVKDETHEEFPQCPRSQLWKAINIALEYWNNYRAIRYRELNNIINLKGTAVNIQFMVFGNLGDTSGTGVAFSRNPATGENKYYGEYLMNAQGEDVIVGIRTPIPVTDLEKQNPKIYKQLIEFKDKLEHYYRDMQDMEFTIQEGDLYLLQSHAGKRTGFAAVKIAVDMVHEELIDKKEAIMRIRPADVEQMLHPIIDPQEKYTALAKGIPASPGAAVGEIVFTSEKAEQLVCSGKKVILVRKEVSPEDIGGVDAAQGILTATGSSSSHASVVARGMGKCCVSGCGDLYIRPDNTCEISGKLFKERDIITLNGTTGEVFAGALKIISPEISGDLQELMEWVDEERTIGVRTNADTPKDCIIARKLGAEGIGLCRTEFMFFEGNRINAFREMIMASDKPEREKALNKMLPMQRDDFIDIFEVMNGCPVGIRLLDPTLYEFIPHSDIELKNLADASGIDFNKLKEKSRSLHESNPMMGHRGCRLAITYPEITVMQTKAIIQAALAVTKKGINVHPEIMAPFLGTEKEFEYLRNIIIETASKILEKEREKVNYMVGAVIELPRACLVADKIARKADFFSFNTNHLTQMTFGYSREDYNIFLFDYIGKGILPCNPFQILDQEGVGHLMRIGIEKGRKIKPNLKVGICGEHAGDPNTIKFCFNIGMNYVSCSSVIVPIARLISAQVKIREDKN